jgi:hypothetical protein
MLRSLAQWGMMPRDLILKSLMPWSLILGQRSCAVICLSGHFFLDLCSLSFEEGALGSGMPTQSVVMAYGRSFDGR